MTTATLTDESSDTAVMSSSCRQIELRGVRVHNLKGIDLDIPLGRLVVITGVSGSGKGSLAFDTLFAEGQRRYIESFSASARQHLERIERPNADRIAHVPPAIAIRGDRDRRRSTSTATVAELLELSDPFCSLFVRAGRVICPGCHSTIKAHAPSDVVQTLNGTTDGLRFQICFPTGKCDAGEAASNWLARGFTRAIIGEATVALDSLGDAALHERTWIVGDRLVVGKTTSERVVESAETAFREGHGECLLLVESSTDGESSCMIDGRRWDVCWFNRHWNCAACRREFSPPHRQLFQPGPTNRCEFCRETAVDKRGSSVECEHCGGSRLGTAALAVRLAGKSIADFQRLRIRDIAALLDAVTGSLSTPELTASQRIRDEISHRAAVAVQLGLGHFGLQRRIETLSCGEVCRMSLAAALGARLTGTLCVIDEPSAGLHPTEMPNLIRSLRDLLKLRNSVVVVEHAPDVIAAADHLIELGPGAGPSGGQVLYSSNDPQNGSTSRTAVTSKGSSSKTDSDQRRTSLRKPSCWLEVQGIRHRHLEGLDVRIPVGELTVVTGISGSGKTSLVTETIVPAVRSVLKLPLPSGPCGQVGSCLGADSFTDCVLVDQAPLTRSARSTAVTWLGVFDDIRDVFAQTGEAKRRGFNAAHFSFNTAQGGQCRSCRGAGVMKQNMQFLPEIPLVCPVCRGSRFRGDVLEVKYRSRTIADVLAMSASEAAVFFRNHPKIQARLLLLKQIGLDYLVLGQPTDTLSGGEAQRLKLASHLTTGRGATLIVCDEPTVGLHSQDVACLLGCFRELLAIGHTILVADNNPELQHAAHTLINL